MTFYSAKFFSENSLRGIHLNKVITVFWEVMTQEASFAKLYVFEYIIRQWNYQSN